MNPEAERYLSRARKLLAEARAILPLGLGGVAGRTAYLAAFHAAQGLIFERRGVAAKTQRGVHAQIASLARDDARFDPTLRSFLSTAYVLKSVADYETGPEAEVPLAGRTGDRLGSAFHRHGGKAVGLGRAVNVGPTGQTNMMLSASPGRSSQIRRA